MSILSTIFGKLFPSSHAANAQAPAAPAASAAPVSANTAPPASTQAPSASQAMTELDVGQLLDGMAAKSNEQLNWKTSIVDLLKLLQLDSSLASRKDLAKELHYTGDTNDSASMNMWLHRQVMNKVAANGGKVPAELKD
ncbi:DUF3597 domain-containing protein [Pseudorhodoferax sp. Leaf274]|uniref:DUF3597 domain-containing protein n=1 Tax=Pseudorhodoferax sp. Leaf274 TaxID=1736318 RepID=UPI0007033B0F|nr:DUF3597 domain-containing protein [Pseudorhodoferax sp. Leaf274]KQP49082.1 hypothetical protein ASF44_00115 [Pseudorhodoferax sp. Leaf274]